MWEAEPELIETIEKALRTQYRGRDETFIQERIRYWLCGDTNDYSSPAQMLRDDDDPDRHDNEPAADDVAMEHGRMLRLGRHREADGPIPGAYSMRSGGAAAFDAEGKLYDMWAANLEQIPEPSEHPRTMRWWNYTRSTARLMTTTTRAMAAYEWWTRAARTTGTQPRASRASPSEHRVTERTFRDTPAAERGRDRRRERP